MAQNNSTLYFLTYNNYYNRIVKYEDTLVAYNEYLVYDPITCNFDPADGVQTSHILSVGAYIADTPKADYVVVADETGAIVSRWFITDAVKVSSTQWNVSLYRDLVVDFYETVITSPTYIERAMCNSGNNLIFNPDNVSFNQIKQRETILKDTTGCPWIVGYISSNLADNKLIQASSKNIAKPEISDYTYDEWQTFQQRGVAKIDSVSFQFIGKINVGDSVHQFIVGSRQEYKKLGSDADYPNVSLYFKNNKVGSSQGPLALTELQSLIEKNETNIGNDVFSVCQGYNQSGPAVLKQAEINTALTVNGILAKDENNETFTATLTPNGKTTQTIAVEAGALYTRLINLMYNNDFIAQKIAGQRIISMTVSYSLYKATVSAYDGYSASATIKAGKVAQLQDAPYKMFCIPYPIDAGTGKIRLSSGVVSPNASIGMNMAMRTAIELTKENVYDLQLLPYCPATNLIGEDGIIDVSTLTGDEIDKYYTLIRKTDDSVLSYMLWCDSSSFTTAIPNPIAVPANGVDFKVEHETSFYRLNSPNYNGSFQFKATANRGVDYFEVDATYKPFTPYIHVAPNFKGLYGADYNDARGLICGGDFSLPTITDAWESYQIQNKNYLNTFNRQVENMETTFNLQYEQYKQASGMGVITSALSGGASGAYIGATVGGGPGATIGGIAGATASAIASAQGRKQDMRYTQALQNEAMSYTKDQFELSLQNIQALPYTLNNVSAFNINNKYFPFLEYFTATDEEKTAYRNKLTYRSMPIGAIGTITDYIQSEPTFISGQVIRFIGLEDDYHVASSLASEIHNGVYI